MAANKLRYSIGIRGIEHNYIYFTQPFAAFKPTTDCRKLHKLMDRILAGSIQGRSNGNSDRIVVAVRSTWWQGMLTSFAMEGIINGWVYVGRLVDWTNSRSD